MTSNSKLKGAFGVVSSITATTSAVTTLRSAREDNDKLLFANAAASIAVAITSALIAVRALRKGAAK